MSIVFDKVSYTYMPKTAYEITALKNVSFEIKPGEFVAIIGHTGSGKSTLIQHMNGLISPTSGDVFVDGVNINTKKGKIKNKQQAQEIKAAKQKVGMVFQYPEHQLFEETVYKDVAFGPRNIGVPENEINVRVRRSINFVGLDYDALKDRTPFSLSGGEMRRIAIAGVIAMRPPYVVLDEPSAGLDPKGRDEIFERIIIFHRISGATVILVSHNMEEVARMANRVIVLDDGKVSLDGDIKDIFLYGQSMLLKAGVNVPPIMNLIDILRKRGLDVNPGAITPDEAAVDILEALRRQEKWPKT